MYADVIGLLLLRNHSIDCSFDYEAEKDFSKQIKKICECREIGHAKCVKPLFDEGYTYVDDHYTTPALEYINENISSIPNRTLTIEEIHQQAMLAVQQGIARTIFKLFDEDPMKKQEIKAFLNTKITQDNDSISADFDPTIKTYKSNMKKLHKLLGENWIEKHKNSEFMEQINFTIKLEEKITEQLEKAKNIIKNADLIPSKQLQIPKNIFEKINTIRQLQSDDDKNQNRFKT